MRYFVLCLLFIHCTLIASDLHDQPGDLLITNATIVVGVGTPAEGPYDIYIKNGLIEKLQTSRANSDLRKTVNNQIDAKDQYVLPGFINMHAHIMHQRANMDMSQPYQYYLWLASGITTVRDVGSNLEKTLEDREKSHKLEIIAPRILAYPGTWGNHSAESLKKRFRNYKKKKVDGLKFGMMDRETFLAASQLANKYKLPVANHVGVEDMNAYDNIAMGTSTIEHWYGIPDAALHGVQKFPSNMNYNNELHRFRYAGRLWREANSDKLDHVLQAMVDNNIAWDPTLVIYEASRDLQRAVSSPWYKDYLHPGLEKFFQPNADSHGSFFWGWTSTDEAYWKENYQLWFKALQQFSNKGGIITTGEDGGYIYQLFGFGYLRELQLHEEAGFHPLQVIRHATHNSAKVLGLGQKLGQIKTGYIADMVIVNGNPMENLQVLLPRNIKPITGDETTGGIVWTIKAGRPYHAPTMLAKVREIVKQSRSKNPVNYLVEP